MFRKQIWYLMESQWDCTNQWTTLVTWQGLSTTMKVDGFTELLVRHLYILIYKFSFYMFCQLRLTSGPGLTAIETDTSLEVSVRAVLSNLLQAMGHFKNFSVTEGHSGCLLQSNPGRGPCTTISSLLGLRRSPGPDHNAFCSIHGQRDSFLMDANGIFHPF